MYHFDYANYVNKLLRNQTCQSTKSDSWKFWIVQINLALFSLLWWKD